MSDAVPVALGWTAIKPMNEGDLTYAQLKVPQDDGAIAEEIVRVPVVVNHVDAAKGYVSILVLTERHEAFPKGVRAMVGLDAFPTHFSPVAVQAAA